MAGDPAAAEPTGPEPLPVPEPTSLTPVRLRCEDVDVRRALEMLSNEASVSILVAPGVTGRVTANLQGLSFEEALGAILRLCNLVAQREGKLVLVYPLADVPQSTRSLRAFPLDYVAAPDAMQGVQGLLSPTGKAFLIQSSPEDNRKMQNVVVVEDLPEYLFRVEQYLKQIDQPPRQVLIEAHVLEVELKDDRQHGVNFKHIMRIMGNAATLQLRGLADPLAAQAFFVNVNGANLEALVECLKTTADAKILASPRVLVLNGQQAHIQIGERFGYRVITTTETSSMQDVKFLDLGVVLTVAPHISRDNQVVMRVKPEVSSGQINPETDLPEEETTEVETDVLLMDGQGMVIGGLIQEKDSNLQSKIPLLGDIWLIGRLFQRRELVKRRSEIIITLLPRVLPYLPDYEAVDQVDTARAATPLLHGPLCRYPRPWEPSLPDTDWRLRELGCSPACR
jgi:type IV pilus assembly protein PilQ